MKVKTISRVEEEATKERKSDLQKVQRNIDPLLHPFERAREYTRALNAAKLEKVFAKPFIQALAGHSDGVFCMAKNPTQISQIISGSCDGELRIWSLSHSKCTWRVNAHSGFVRGVAVSRRGEYLVSCGDDKTVKLWGLSDIGAPEGEQEEVGDEPADTYFSKTMLLGIDHHWKEPSFATCGTQVDLWDHNRSEPTATFSWGAESVTSIKYNPVETQILASTGSDRNITLYDVRSQTALRKLTMQMRTNTIAWNPMEAFNFVAANEDHNLYTYDMRKLNMALCVHKDHVSAVLDVDFSPTGREFVSGSYDRTLRIYNFNEGHSREVYFTKRMQRIFAVKYSMDSKYVLSASDDMNIRLWKANAAEQLGVLLPREKAKSEYQAALKDRYKYLPEIRKVIRSKHVPKAIHKAAQTKDSIKKAQQVKEKRVRAHSAPDSIPHPPDRKKRIVAITE
eukprot:tig00000615_g2597.t1